MVDVRRPFLSCIEKCDFWIDWLSCIEKCDFWIDWQFLAYYQFTLWTASKEINLYII